MNTEDQVVVAMRRAAEMIEPRVDALVDGGVARGRRRRVRNRVRATGVIAVVGAAAVAAGVVPARSGGGTPTPTPSVRLASATQVLDRAARAAQARPEVWPNPRQWLYSKMLEVGIGAEHGMRPVTSESWMRIDGRQEAGFRDGKLVIETKTPGTRAGGIRAVDDRFASADPAELRVMIYKMVDVTPRRDWQSDRDGEAYFSIAQTLWSTPVGLSSQTQAALFRVLATIPGVRIVPNVKDGAGRPAIAITHGFGEQFLLDPVTYQVIGRRTVFNGHNAPISKTAGVDPRYNNIRPGTVTYSLTRLTAKVVDRPGQR
jgi:hypothetical protein